MTWAEFHSKSELLASQAEMAARAGNADRATALFRSAAEEEERALEAVPKEKRRTVGITAVSAASLWFMGRELNRCQAVAFRWLQQGTLPPFAVRQLRDLLEMVWGEEMRAQSPIKFLPGDLLVSVSGGEVLYGGAPMDLILQKVEGMKAVVIRTIEMLLELPLRRSRTPSELVRQHFEPWLIQQPAGSYQFAVRVRAPSQMDLFPDRMPAVEAVATKAIDILRAAVEDPQQELLDVVPDKEYRSTFLKLTRNLAPTGKTFAQLSVGSATAPAAPVVMLPEVRSALNHVLRQETTRIPSDDQPEEVEIRGILRGLSLDRDWLEVVPPSGLEADTIRIYDAGETLDDVIGPMVNRPVIVDTYRKRGQARLHLRDIQPAE